MKSIRLITALLLVACCASFTGCGTLPTGSSAAKDWKTPKEVCELERLNDSTVPETPALVGVLGSALGQWAGKALLRLTADGLNAYADQYEASYSGRLIAADFHEIKPKPRADQPSKTLAAGQKTALNYQFTRYLVFEGKRSAADIEAALNKKGLKVDEADLTPLPDPATGNSNTRYTAFRMTFSIVRAGSKGDAMRILPTKITYNTPAAKQLRVPWTKKDEIKSTISISLREAYLPDAKNFNRKAEFSGTLDEFEGAGVNSALFASDWMPAIADQAYSIEVKVLETSDAKKWIQKAATKLGEWGNAQLDELKDN